MQIFFDNILKNVFWEAFYIHNFLNQTIWNDSEIKRQIKQISIKCLDKLSLFSLEKEEVDYYIKEYLEPYILTLPIYWFTNPLVRVIKEHVGNELPTCFLFSISEIENSEEFLKALDIEVERYNDKILNDEDITEEECEELFTVAKLNIGLDIMTVINFIFKKITMKKLVIGDVLYQEIFLEYVSWFKTVNQYAFFAFFKNIPDTIEDGATYTTDAEVLKQNGVIYIRLNKKHFKCENILLNLFVIYHEVRHIFQETDLNTSIYLRDLFKMDKYLKTNVNGYLKHNYDKLSYEADANLYGCMLLLKYLHQLKIKKYNREIIKHMFSFNKMRYETMRLDSYARPITLNMFFSKVASSFCANPDDLCFVNTFSGNGDRLRPILILQKMRGCHMESYGDLLLGNATYSKAELGTILEALIKAIQDYQDDKEYLEELYQIYKGKYEEAPLLQAEGPINKSYDMITLIRRNKLYV